MKLAFIIPVSLLLLTASCGGSGEKKILSVEKKEVLKAPEKVAVNRELSVDIAGMTCEQGCGGTIRMALKETGAVDRCSFDFEDGRKVNTAYITFDKDKISPDKILAIISKLNDKQFTTSNPATKTVEEKESTAPQTDGTKTSSLTPQRMIPDASVDVETYSVDFPDLFELLSRLVR
jgi:hypothetical protein